MEYIWLVWSLLLLSVWLIVYIILKNKRSRKEMLIVSLWTGLLGFTEPIFVPEYWNPPSLFNLAEKTGFDIESIIFAFAIGGLAVVLYEFIFKIKYINIDKKERHNKKHKYHLFALLSAPIIFIILYLIIDWNPIYSTFIALIIGGIATWYCRPDLKNKMISTAFLFTIFYFLFFLTLDIAYPGYIDIVWNFETISGILIIGIPLEELMFAFSFGFLWSSIYEHIKWNKIIRI